VCGWFDPRCPVGQLGFNDVRGGSIREPLSTQTEQRVANRGAPIRTPCRVSIGYGVQLLYISIESAFYYELMRPDSTGLYA